MEDSNVIEIEKIYSGYTDEELKERHTQLRVRIKTLQNKYEESFEDFKERVKTKLPEEYYSIVGINVEELTARHWLPHLYIEPFNSEEYEKERILTNNLFTKVHNFKENLKKEVAKEMGMEGVTNE